VLEPLNRRHLFDALRPPSQYDLEAAIGTTFSLDLMTLLGVPLAFALFDAEDDQGRIEANPVALLEAGRRYADVMHIFCHAGRIYLPKQPSPLLHQFEGVVHEVVPPDHQGVFHPKLWVLRFAHRLNIHPDRYRLLCSSRNLTFDQSWDTLVVLEGELTDRERAIAQNHALGDLIQALPGMMTSPPNDHVREAIDRVQYDLRRVKFAVPDGFEEVRFHALGLEKGKHWWFDWKPSQVLAMAPFVDWNFVKRLARSGNSPSCLLISRLEQLQELRPTILSECHKVYYLDPAADEPTLDDDGPECGRGPLTTEERPDSNELFGLHAKLFIADCGWNAAVFTGSANATGAAVSRNVEFLVELRGKKSMCGVDAFLARVKGQTCFADMLREFTPEKEQPTGNEELRKAEEITDQARQAVASLGLKATVTPLDSEHFDVEIRADQIANPSVLHLPITLYCWPVTIHERNGSTALDLLRGGTLRFSKLSLEALTSFFAFYIQTTVGKSSCDIRFVLNLPIHGMPADRAARMLRLILHNRSQIWRMLVLLLADSGGDILDRLGKLGSNGHRDEDTSDVFSSLGEFPLLETLLRTLEHNPESLRRVARLVEDVCKTDGGSELLPDGFLQVWPAIWQVAQELCNEHRQR